MRLPDALDAGDLGDAVVVVRGGDALAGAVVHHHHLRLDGPEVGGGPRPVERPVAAGLIHGDGTQPVDGARQLHLHVPVEVAEVHEAEPAEAEQRAQGALVLGRRGRPVLGPGAVGVGPAVVDGLRDELHVGRDHPHLDVAHRHHVPGPGHHSRVAGGLQVDVAPLLVPLLGLAAVIEEPLDLDHPRELGETADVIGVEVRDQHVVELLEPGVLHRGHDAMRIAALGPRPAGVDEHRLAGRGDDEGRAPALDVDPVDVHGLGRRGHRRAQGAGEGTDHHADRTCRRSCVSHHDLLLPDEGSLPHLPGRCDVPGSFAPGRHRAHAAAPHDGRPAPRRPASTSSLVTATPGGTAPVGRSTRYADRQ